MDRLWMRSRPVALFMQGDGDAIQETNALDTRPSQRANRSIAGGQRSEGEREGRAGAATRVRSSVDTSRVGK